MTTTEKTDLKEILKTLKPKLNAGDFVFCTGINLPEINLNEIVMFFHEEEGNTIIIKKELADNLNLKYSFVSSWITLSVHSSLSAVGLTAAFSNTLAEKGISCNIVAAYHHDHIFVDKKDAAEAMNTLVRLSE